MEENMDNKEMVREFDNKRLLNIQDVCTYLGIGNTKARELLRGRNGFGLQIGNRWYADKRKLDKWISDQIC